MQEDIIHYVKKRYTTKSFNPEKKISKDNIEKIKDLLKFCPSSVNVQPWSFVIASTHEGKEQIAKSTKELYPFNTNSIINASHVIVFCSKIQLEEEYLQNVLSQEDKDGRFKTDISFKEQLHQARNMFINLHKDNYKDLNHWIDKQVYINVGSFLLGVATLGIDATPMEGIDTLALDKELSLKEKGYRSLVVVPIGYHDTNNDYNAKLPKSRLNYNDILTEI